MPIFSRSVESKIRRAARRRETVLDLADCQLTALPPEIGQLTSLTELRLDGNQLTELPPEIGQLTNLTDLWLGGNKLTEFPPGIGQLTSLNQLGVDGNPLTSPPPAIIEQGTEAILAYLREQQHDARRQWVCKLLVVGEGGVGKTALLRALRGEEFISDLPTTHGIEIRPLELVHPSEADTLMRLNSWDFGGQEIYHATHQFFLTGRSVFLLVWNARHGYEAGKLDYWLDTIQGRAPDSRVVLVATWTDERDTGLPFQDLQARYPQVIGQFSVSNKRGTGIDDLREELTNVAAQLPLMGETWPATWLAAAEAIRSSDERHITAHNLSELMTAQGVAEADVPVLAQYLHELGDILYFQRYEETRDIVILKPQWLTEHVSMVLESEQVVRNSGIFTGEDMDRLWSSVRPDIRTHFLAMMEQFDLSYRTMENREVSLVVECLPLDPPPEFDRQWAAVALNGQCREITMRFQLASLPAGIPTWFIARSHRFTTHTHWRLGAVFADGPEQKHLALVQAFPYDRCVQLTVRGPSPFNFFALLRDGLEVTLERFKGLKVERRMPCPGHDGEPCEHEFEYDNLTRAIERIPPVEQLQCPVSFAEVSVPEMLFGLHLGVQDRVLTEIDRLHAVPREKMAEFMAELTSLRELTDRGFTTAYKREQSKIESHCPNVFVLRPRGASRWKQVLKGQRMDLQLYCQMPGRWHPTLEGGLYEVDDAPSWLMATAPYLRVLFPILKRAAPLAGPWTMAIPWEVMEEIINKDIETMAALLEMLPTTESGRLPDVIGPSEGHAGFEPARGAPLRALRQLLDRKDPYQTWGALEKVHTPEGHYLWLCPDHARPYAK